MLLISTKMDFFLNNFKTLKKFNTPCMITYYYKRFSESYFNKKYNEESLKKILEVLNSAQTEDFTRFKLSRVRTAGLLSYRSENGNFDKLDDVLKVDGFDIPVLTKLCNNIAKIGNTDESKLLKLQRQLLSPELTNVDYINTAAGIHIGTNSLSWALIRKEDSTLCDWNVFPLGDMNSKKFALNDLLKLSLQILKHIPPADLYVFESFLAASPSSQQQLLSLLIKQKTMQLNCILMTLLNTSPTHNKSSIFNNKNLDISQNETNVHFLRSKTPARLFQTLVGNENVSAETTVLKIISEKNDASYSSVTVPEKFKALYENSPAIEKEILGQALMLVLSFMSLCVYQNTNSLKAISSRSKKNG